MSNQLVGVLRLALLAGLPLAVVVAVFLVQSEPCEVAVLWDLVPECDSSPYWTETSQLRMFAKNRIARDLIDGRWSLFEAAALFRELDRLHPKIETLACIDGCDPNHSFPERTDAERLCRNVFFYVRSVLEDHPSDLEQVRARLEG